LGKIGASSENLGFPWKIWGFQWKFWGFHGERSHAENDPMCGENWGLRGPGRARMPNGEFGVSEVEEGAHAQGRIWGFRGRGGRALCSVRAPSGWHARDRLGMPPSVWHARPPFGNPKFSPETPNYPHKPQTLPWACAPPIWHVLAPLGMCTLRFASTRSLAHVHPPFGTRALPWACAPAVTHGRAPLGMCALLRLACARSLGHVHAPFGMCSLRLAFVCSPGNACPSFRMRALPCACAHPLGHASPPFGMRAPSVRHARALRSACARSLGHARPTLLMCALPWACAPCI
jgi:hypothetical protein